MTRLLDSLLGRSDIDDAHTVEQLRSALSCGVMISGSCSIGTAHTSNPSRLHGAHVVISNIPSTKTPVPDTY